MTSFRPGFVWAWIFLAASRATLGADAATSQAQFWPEVDAYVGLSEQTRLFFQYTATREKQLEDYADGLIGGYLDLYMLPLVRYKLREHPDPARSRYLMLRVGYAYSYNPPTGKKKAVTDHIPTFEATGRAPLPGGILLTDRNRFDFRFVNGAFQPRYRNRLKLERSFKTGRFLLTPYADTEIFYDWRYGKFNEIRYEGGMEWAVTHYFTLEGYYTRQRTTTSTPEYVNALGLEAEFYFRNRK